MSVVIEMVSDLVCPWCWLGKRRIESAIALVPDIDVQLLFRPYELDPTIPAGGVDYKDYMRKAFGSPEAKERSGMMRQALIDYGEAEDIPYRFDNISWRPNSLDAHRLVHWAQGQDKGAAAILTGCVREPPEITETDRRTDGGHDKTKARAPRLGLASNCRHIPSPRGIMFRGKL